MATETKENVPETIEQLKKVLPKGFRCKEEPRSMGKSIHVWNTGDDTCFDADFYVDNRKYKKQNVAAAYAAVRAFVGEEK